MADTPKLPEGAADWTPPTDDELDALAEVTAADIEAAKTKASEHGGLLDDLLNAEPYNA